jgi:hypothetical protein
MNNQKRPTFAQTNLDIFLGQNPGQVLWQPRLEFWYTVNKVRGTLPPHLKEASLLDLYDYCRASVRYFTWPLRVERKNVQITEKWLDEKHRKITWETPEGVLTETVHYDEWNLSAYNSEYRLKGPQDFPIWEYILQDEEWSWDQEAYERDLAFIGGRGAPQFYFRRSPVQGLFIENMGFETAIFLLQDDPALIDRYVGVASDADDAMYEVLCKCPVTILNFGENIDTHMDPPTVWRKHLLPYYNKRVAQLHAAGKRTHIHIDGAMKPLLQVIRESPFTGIEACTPLPQGDVTLDEIKAALGDKVLLDGIPAVYFLPYFPEEELTACTKQVIELFHPRLALGISDEIPPDGDIERVRRIGELVEEMG